MKLFGYPVVLSDDFSTDASDKPFLITFGDLSVYTVPMTADEVLNLLSKREIEIPAERLEILT
jgi:hypothetical protein